MTRTPNRRLLAIALAAAIAAPANATAPNRRTPMAQSSIK